MIPERVADNVYVFTSKNYAEVNAGAVVGEDWGVLIDTLAYPEETLEIKEFIENKLECPIRYVVNTHFHFDHALGNCWFPDATIISSALCKELLDSRGRDALQAAKEQNHELDKVHIALPDVVFDKGSISIRIDKRTLTLLPMPGHSPDGIAVLIEEDRVLFSGDAIMGIPTILDGDIPQLVESLKRIPDLRLENIIPGHGDVILRGEVEPVVEQTLEYLDLIEKNARKALRRKDPEGFLRELDVEDAGFSRILLNGLAPTLHYRNMVSLYSRMKQEE
ncbi:MAG: MBL fold metallo-hydrolase [Anaerolineales bacterium]|nr:MBL fold metallo-hydrolase [Anaerolineales bacterium]